MEGALAASRWLWDCPAILILGGSAGNDVAILASSLCNRPCVFVRQPLNLRLYDLSVQIIQIERLGAIFKAANENAQGGEGGATVALFGSFGADEEEQVNDPFGRSEEEFERVFVQVVRMSHAFLEKVLKIESTNQ